MSGACGARFNISSVIWHWNPFAFCTKIAAGRACNPDLLPSVTVRSTICSNISIPSVLQDEKNITSGLHLSTGAADDCSVAGGNDGAQHHLAHTLDDRAIKAHDGGSSLHYLAFGGNVLEALTFQFDCIKPKMH